MTASSTTGISHGSARKVTTAELATLAKAPSIIFTGAVEVSESSSPPIDNDTIVFPYPLPGGADNYVIMLTTVSAGYAYVTDRDEDDDENFTGFSFVTETDGTVMYLVAKIGSRPNI